MQVTQGRNILSEHRSSLLETDGRIIAENDDHIVLSVRVSKDNIRANQHLLFAISDCAIERRREGPSPISGKPAPRGKWRPRIGHIARTAVAAVALTGCTKGLLAIIASPPAIAINWLVTLALPAIGGGAVPASAAERPIVLHQINVMTDFVQAGQPMTLEAVISRPRSCEAEVERIFRNPDTGQQIRHHYVGIMAPVAKGTYRHKFTIDAPENLTPGGWRIKIAISSHCPDGDFITANDPPAWFTVAADPEKRPKVSIDAN